MSARGRHRIAEPASTGSGRAAGLIRLAICLALVLAVVRVFGRTVGFEFTNYDDPEYVVGNAAVLEGLSWSLIRWAFTATEQANWHPLTWLSLMLDVEWFGPNPGAMHLVNVLIHAASTVVLFLTLERATGARGASALVAALFGVHPLHVESVAWIAERKDVLSTLFWFLTMAAWIGWVQRPTRARRGAVSVLLALGLLAKPMLVTLPAVLVLLDYWPLARGRELGLRRLLVEKLDLFLLVAASCVVTLYAQHAGGALGSLDTYPLLARLVNAVIACAVYLAKTVWPTGLAAFYPHPGASWDPVALVLALAILSAISVTVARAGRARPYLITGWLWYLGTLVPVLGIVQVGLQSMADRYTYIPLVGVFLIVAWGARDLAALVLPGLGARTRAALLAGTAAVAVVALGEAARVQVAFWRNGVSLFERTLRVTRDNPVAENNLGSALYRRRAPGDLERSVLHYREAVRINPRYHAALNNLAGALLQLGRVDEAKAEWRRALAVKPDYVSAACNLAGACVRTGDIEEAIELCRRALAADPDAACAHYNLAMAYLRQSNLLDAERHFQLALRVEPGDSDTRLNLGVVLARLGRLPEAVVLFEQVLRSEPGNAAARANFERARSAMRGAAAGPGTAARDAGRDAP